MVRADLQERVKELELRLEEEQEKRSALEQKLSEEVEKRVELERRVTGKWCKYAGYM